MEDEEEQQPSNETNSRGRCIDPGILLKIVDLLKPHLQSQALLA